MLGAKTQPSTMSGSGSAYHPLVVLPGLWPTNQGIMGHCSRIKCENNPSPGKLLICYNVKQIYYGFTNIITSHIALISALFSPGEYTHKSQNKPLHTP